MFPVYMFHKIFYIDFNCLQAKVKQCLAQHIVPRLSLDCDYIEARIVVSFWLGCAYFTNRNGVTRAGLAWPGLIWCGLA